MNTYFTADTHFGDSGVLKITERPWSDTDVAGEAILDAINSTVGRRDRLFIVGDFGHTRPEFWRQKIKSKELFLIIGNHDCNSKHQGCRYSHLFQQVYMTRMLKLPQGRVFLSHYPHAIWPSSHHGVVHLYGHVHSQREAWLDNALGKGRKSMDVGIENAIKLLGPRPFSAEEVFDILGHRPGHHDLAVERTFT